MEISKIKILSSLGITSERTSNIFKQIFFTSIFKGGSVIANYMLVPITLGYLDTANYGLWLTITSFVGWFAFFDIGIGNGLRNKYTEAKANNNLELARSYVSTAYFFICIISILLTIVLFVINSYVNWTLVFNTKSISANELSKLMFVVIGFFNLNLVAQLIITIYIADQKAHVAGVLQFLIQSISVIIIWILSKTISSSLLIFGTIISGLPVLILFIFTIYSFFNKYKEVIPKFRLVNKSQTNEIFNVGLSFFILQISCVVLYATDNMIISHFFGPEKVTPYNIAYKYFSIAYILFNIILSPYWSGITDANSKNDFEWIRNSMKYLKKYSYIVILLIFVMYVVSDKVYYLWIGKSIQIPTLLSILMGIYFSLIVFMQPFVFFVNGTGKIRLQLIFSVITAVLNIPLSIYFAKDLGFGISGVILSTIMCSIPGVIYVPIQYSKIINKKAKGIWNK